MSKRFGKVLIGVAAGILALATPALSFGGQHPEWEQFRNNLAPYVPAPEKAVDRMLSMARLRPGETLFDLGCGNGNILITAVQRYKVKAVGIEISDRLARNAAERVRKEGLSDEIRVVHGDFMRQDLSSANVVTLYLATTANDTLRPNLERFLRPSTRVVSYDYPIPGWKPLETAEATGSHGTSHTIYLYQVPESIQK
jgi:SAM-dependent methyltransferase